MATIQLENITVALEAGESVLEALERTGLDVPSGCRAGACTKCMLQADGKPPVGSQRGLRPTLQSQGYFLACQAYPTEPLKLRSAVGPDPIDARLEKIALVASDVAQLFLRPLSGFEYRPGQYLDVFHPSGERRSYSVASLSSSGLLELHVRLVSGGLMSGWLHGLSAGETVRIRGPFGQCFHIADEPSRKLLLIGAGTGLAPLLGIARDAVEQGHTGSMFLVHGGLDPSRFYLRDELAQLASKTPQLDVHHCVLRDATNREHEGALDKVAIDLVGSLDNARAFLCGDEGIVRVLQRSLFMAGMSSAEIFADPFLATLPIKA
ncbi:MAG: CDP-4-dehydro-6-deoxyglucose reductase [Planctomycetota bacterium]|jgi:CDP-4-dehydro-6-deoxyglucose reductase